jgi:hypothetical protein
MRKISVVVLFATFIFACSGPEKKLVDAQCKCDQKPPEEKLNCFEDVEKEFSSEIISEMDVDKLANAMLESACNKVEGEDYEPLDEESAKTAAQQIIDYHKGKTK